MNTPEYIQTIVGVFLSDRKIQFAVEHVKKEYKVEAGVPQGSVVYAFGTLCKMAC